MKFTYKIDDELTLRLIEPRQAEELFALVDANREAMLPWMRWVNEVTDVESMRVMIERWHEMKNETGCVSLGVELEGELVGAVFHVHPDLKNRQVEVGYWLAQSARGRGVATRAVRTMLDITFRDLGFNRVNVRIAPQNSASLAIAQRLGLTREGVTRQAWWDGQRYWDAVEFGVLSHEWLAGRGGSSASDNPTGSRTDH
jgi:ribosomal-protein-serine acetyltransferase